LVPAELANLAFCLTDGSGAGQSFADALALGFVGEAQGWAGDTIAMFELELKGEDVKVVEERHYKLAPAEEIGPEDLKRYAKR
jgi:hypothetical protein